VKRSYTYSYRTGVVYKKVINAKKTLFGVMATFMMAGAMAVPALAASTDYCGSSATGCAAAAAAGAQCGSGAGSGTFGALGKNNSLGAPKVHDPNLGSYPGPGTDGQATGVNNSAICGNRP